MATNRPDIHLLTADMAMYPYTRAHSWAKVPIDGLPHLAAWFERLDDRPALQRALEKPEPFPAFFGKGDAEAAQALNAARFAQDARPNSG